MQKNQRNILIGLIIILIISIVGIVLILSQRDSSEQNGDDVSVSASEGEIVTFSGTLTDFDSSCAFDGQCIAYVDDYEIIISPGLSIAGTIVGSSDVNADHIGRNVRVRAQVVSDNQLTIVGDASLYVLLDI